MVQQDNLIVKLKPIVIDPGFNVADHLNEIVGKHVFDKVEQMFPDESDKELASIYIAKVSGNSEINHNQIIDSLNNEHEIDYAHVPGVRTVL